MAQWYRTNWPRTPDALNPSLLLHAHVRIYSSAGLIMWTPPPMFSDTTITNCHSDTTIFQLGVDISWSTGSENSLGQFCAAGGRRTLDFLCEWQTNYPLGQMLHSGRQTMIQLFYTIPYSLRNISCFKFALSGMGGVII